MTTALNDEPESDLPNSIYDYLRPNAWGQHGDGFLPWGHKASRGTIPHSHTILEDNTVEQKNAMADHIETYHKNRG